MGTCITTTTHEVSCVGYFPVRSGLKLVSVFVLMAPLAAQADDGDLKIMDEVSVTASRVSTAIKESPVTIDIIGEEELDTVKFVDSETELLNRIPGTSLSRNLRIPIGSRNYTVNLLDGMTVGKFGSGVQSFANDMNSLDIQRVEVLRGPSSVLYGSNAIGGVINVITKDAPLEPEHKVWGEVGMNERVRGGVSAAGTAEGIGYFLDANFLETENEQARTGNSRKTLAGKITKDLSDESLLTLRAEYLDVFKENPGTLSTSEYNANWQQAGMQDAFTDEQMATASAAYMYAPNDVSELNFGYSIRRHNEAGHPSYSATADYGEDEVLNQNFTGTYRRDFDFYRSRVIGGLDVVHSDANEVNFNGRNSSAAIDANWDIVAVGTSPFVQFEISPLEKLRFTMGTRYDRVKYDADDKFATSDASTRFSSITRKAGATYSLNANNSMWVGYGEGFVVPSRTNLFVGSWNYTANPELKAEQANNIEIGFRGKLLDKRLQYDVALYKTIIEDMIVVQDAGGAPSNQLIKNAGKTRFRGLEASVGYLLMDTIKVDGAYTLSRNEYLSYIDDGSDYSGNDLTLSPKHHVNLRATWMPMDDLDIELEWDKISSYYTNADNGADGNGKASRPGIFNLRVSYKDGPISYWGHARNLLDSKYAETISYSTSTSARSYTSGQPLTLYAGISYNW